MTFSAADILVVALVIGLLALAVGGALVLRRLWRRWRAAEQRRGDEFRQLVRRVHQLEQKLNREVESVRRAERATADVVLGLTRSLIRREEERSASDRPPR